jgi:biotin synthase
LADGNFNTAMTAIRHDWSLGELREIHQGPVLELIHRAAVVHREFHDSGKLQVCKLISIKTGGCPEDCAYCAQSARYHTGVSSEKLLDKETVMGIARRAKESGVSRVCLGAAWREVKDNGQFDAVLEMVRDISAMDLEVCCTLGMLTKTQAQKLEAAGLHAYNHNLDSSAEFYPSIISTRSYEDRLRTLSNVRQTNVTLCSGGIIGLGETVDDRLKLLQTLAQFRPHPESVPINVLAKVPGTPLANEPDISIWDVVRIIATARLVMPRSDVRLTAGRARISEPEQALCFLAGANSIFSSDNGHMLTQAVPSPSYDTDRQLMNTLGLKPRE